MQADIYLRLYCKFTSINLKLTVLQEILLKRSPAYGLTQLLLLYLQENEAKLKAEEDEQKKAEERFLELQRRAKEQQER